MSGKVGRCIMSVQTGPVHSEYNTKGVYVVVPDQIIR